MVAYSNRAHVRLYTSPLQGHTGFTERDWLFLFGHPREVVISRRLVLRFAALWLAVVMVSFGITVYILPYGVGLFAGAAVLTIAGILPIVPRWFG
ncbi:MAG: hypothetical protein DME20_07940 [Verrucomicrobia bacterium]|nr:MAG: hypothetical protein DME20_07940 [Verrucomicrobiota bacterium]